MQDFCTTLYILLYITHTMAESVFAFCRQWTTHPHPQSSHTTFTANVVIPNLEVKITLRGHKLNKIGGKYTVFLLHKSLYTQMSLIFRFILRNMRLFYLSAAKFILFKCIFYNIYLAYFHRFNFSSDSPL